jgi:hypothetical protein
VRIIYGDSVVMVKCCNPSELVGFSGNQEISVAWNCVCRHYQAGRGLGLPRSLCGAWAAPRIDDHGTSSPFRLRIGLRRCRRTSFPSLPR